MSQEDDKPPIPEDTPNERDDEDEGDLVEVSPVTGSARLRTWECPTHKIVVAQGDPCPKCGKKLLLD